MVQGKRTVDDEEIVKTMRKSRDPAFSTAELAEEFNMSTEGIRQRLKTLAEDGDVCWKKASARTVLWWVEQDQRESVLSK